MKLATLQRILQSLNRVDVQYLVVGGTAVVAHGYGRMTYDLDIVVHLTRDNILRAFSVLERLGYKPKVPITGRQFADRRNREKWIREKGMMVLNFFSDKHPDTPVDIFVEEPFDFAACYRKAIEEEISKGSTFRYVDIATLIAMKKKAARDKDKDDIKNLRIIRRMARGG
jgi:hypothetical protein